MKNLEADYLVVGAGAMGMAFTDTLITETNARVIMVDRQHQPGGHWNLAYPYVRLHQPSAFYGVNSKPLGADALDTAGWNKGLYELATNGEVCAYFDSVMQRQFLPSDRVQYFPMCEYDGGKRFHSLVSGEAYQVAATKVVDATYMNVTVPSIRPPSYAVADGVACVPPNGLPKLAGQYHQFCVVGAGKTGMDACLFLLKHGIDPDAIRWIMPRDSWLLNRAVIQPGTLFADAIGQVNFRQTQAMAEATSLEDLLERVTATEFLMRFDPDVWPTMWRCATVTEAELEQLRRIRHIVRMGRVQQITADQIVLDQGQVPTNGTTLHIDCSADGLERRPQRPVFADDAITLQSVRTCQQVFSAAFVGYVEANYGDDAEKNDLCGVIPHPDDNLDFARTNLANLKNAGRWAQDEALQLWLTQARLDGFSRPVDPAVGVSADQQRQFEQFREVSQLAAANLERLLGEYG